MEEHVQKDVDRRIQSLKKKALELRKAGGEIPAIERNVVRILASVKMLEINISDLLRI